MVAGINIANALLNHPATRSRNSAIAQQFAAETGQVQVQVAQAANPAIAGWADSPRQPHQVSIHHQLIARAQAAGGIDVPEYHRICFVIGATIFHEVCQETEPDTSVGEEGYIMEYRDLSGTVDIHVNGANVGGGGIEVLDATTPVTDVYVRARVNYLIDDQALAAIITHGFNVHMLNDIGIPRGRAFATQLSPTR